MARHLRRPIRAVSAPAPSVAVSDALRRAGPWVLGLLTLGLGAYALFAHRVGDYLTESDFYGGYAAGARALRAGHVDFSRYGVYGPVYEALLAVAGLMVPDLFTAARLLSVLAAGVTLAAWWRVAERRAEPLGALLLVLLLALNPTFARYGYSATTDMAGLAFFSLAVASSLTARGPRAPLWTGLWAGLAALTRYNLLAALPAALMVEWGRGDRPCGARLRAMALVLAGAALTLAPWTALSLRAGHLPGADLIAQRAFFLGTAPGAAIEEPYRALVDATGESPAPPAPALALPPAREWGAPAAWLARRAVEHVGLVARDLLGPPAAALSLLGLVALALARERALLTLAPIALWAFAVLVPVFHSDRYAMVLVPMALLPGAVALARLARARASRPLPALAAAALALLVVVPTVRWAWAYHRACRAAMPLETLAAGAALRRVADPWEPLLARKAHVAFQAGVPAVPFPAVGTLPELARFCRERSVRYLYYSWYEAHMRPAFAFLLDTSVVVPGLEVMHVTRERPSVVYRVDSHFGETPAWWGDPGTRERVALRVNALLQPGRDAVPFLLRLADREQRRGRHDAALADAREALRLAPESEEARRIERAALQSIAARLARRPGGRPPG